MRNFCLSFFILTCFSGEVVAKQEDADLVQAERLADKIFDRVEDFMLYKSTDEVDQDRLISEITSDIMKSTTSEGFFEISEMLEEIYVQRILTESKEPVSSDLFVESPKKYFKTMLRPVNNRMSLRLVQMAVTMHAIPVVKEQFSQDGYRSLNKILELLDQPED